VASAFGTSYRFREPGTAERRAVVSIAANALVLVVVAVADVVVATGDRSWVVGSAWNQGTGSTSDLIAPPLRWMATLEVAIGVLAALYWLIWQAQATENQWAAGRPTEITPAWAVLWWFVPFAQLGKPAVAVRQLLRASAPADARGDSALVATWWTLFLTGSVLRFVGFLVLVGSALAGLENGAASSLHASDVAPGLWVSAVGAVSFALAGWPAIAIVRRVDARQATLHGDLVGATGSHAPPPRPDTF
jgi:hypothetical protein